ncbi:hypothetical protein YC2023_088570 [Brassica napus]
MPLQSALNDEWIGDDETRNVNCCAKKKKQERIFESNSNQTQEIILGISEFYRFDKSPRHISDEHITDELSIASEVAEVVSLTGSNAAVAVTRVCRCGWLRFLAVLRDLYNWFCGYMVRDSYDCLQQFKIVQNGLIDCCKTPITVSNRKLRLQIVTEKPVIPLLPIKLVCRIML